jgi:hypothetical protein
VYGRGAVVSSSIVALVEQSAETGIWAPVVQPPTPANPSLDNGLEPLAEAASPSCVVSMLPMAKRRKCFGYRCLILLSMKIDVSVS